MSQVMKGQILGSPGPAGSPAIVIVYGSGNPNASTDQYVIGASIGSLYIDYTGYGIAIGVATLWFKTGTQTWNQIAVP
jgi:hypothetical protein